MVLGKGGRRTAGRQAGFLIREWRAIFPGGIGNTVIDPLAFDVLDAEQELRVPRSVSSWSKRHQAMPMDLCCNSFLLFSVSQNRNSLDWRMPRSSTDKCPTPIRSARYGARESNRISISTITTNYFGHKDAATKPVAQEGGIPKILALAIAALAAISLVAMFLVDDPLLVALLFAATYTLFWINLRGAMK